jgi:hypothetical protein
VVRVKLPNILHCLSAGKREANELVSSGGSIQTVSRRPAPSAGCAPLPAFTLVTGQQAALGSRQLGPPEVGATYAAALAGPVAPSQPSGSLKPTAVDLDMSEPAVSSETANRRMSNDMSGPLSDMPHGQLGTSMTAKLIFQGNVWPGV